VSSGDESVGDLLDAAEDIVNEAGPRVLAEFAAEQERREAEARSFKGRMRRLFTDAETAAAAVEPPPETRAYFRGRCIDRYGAAIVAANWDSLVFDVGEDTLKRVPMMDPLRGSRDLVAGLIDRSPSAADLVRALGGGHGRTGT
jgi:proteasome accessory factor A